MSKNILRNLLFVFAFVLFTGPALAAETFVFTAIPDQDEARLQERFGKVAAYLSKALGIDVKYVPVKSYAAAVTAFRESNGSSRRPGEQGSARSVRRRERKPRTSKVVR